MEFIGLLVLYLLAAMPLASTQTAATVYLKLEHPHGLNGGHPRMSPLLCSFRVQFVKVLKAMHDGFLPELTQSQEPDVQVRCIALPMPFFRCLGAPPPGGAENTRTRSLQAACSILRCFVTLQNP